MRKRNPVIRFAVCIDNAGYEASLEFGKLYQIVPNTQANERGYLTIIDESGEDYWYAAQRFFPLKIPSNLARALSRST
jgi:hypothetical protein